MRMTLDRWTVGWLDGRKMVLGGGLGMTMGVLGRMGRQVPRQTICRYLNSILSSVQARHEANVRKWLTVNGGHVSH